jgi:hypothetical protein
LQTNPIKASFGFLGDRQIHFFCPFDAKVEHWFEPHKSAYFNGFDFR